MEEKSNEMNLWLLFKLNKHIFALNSFYIDTIMTIPDEITEIPNSSQYLYGIIHSRGEVIPLLDLRKMLGYSSRRIEYQDFVRMIDQRKEDHLYWVKELDSSVREGSEFTLSTDAHSCAFGKWYDAYQTDELSIMHHMRKIKEPHERLHQVAQEVENCKQNCDSCQRSECLKDAMHRLESEYVPEILRLLDECKEIFTGSFRELVVVLDHSEGKMGIVVDDVLSVEELEEIKSDENSKIYDMSFVDSAARSKNSEEMILMLNSSKLIHFFDKETKLHQEI